jgi:phosphoserine aminotransferase
MLEKGIGRIRQETDYKSSLLYHTLKEHPLMQPFVKEPLIRSKTVIVAETSGSSEQIIHELKKHQLIVGSGYGSFKSKHVRIANFPTHSKEQFELLADKINALK